MRMSCFGDVSCLAISTSLLNNVKGLRAFAEYAGFYLIFRIPFCRGDRISADKRMLNPPNQDAFELPEGPIGTTFTIRKSGFTQERPTANPRERGKGQPITPLHG
jgi:hypothetical protein